MTESVVDALFSKLEEMKKKQGFCWKRRIPVAPVRLQPLHVEVRCAVFRLLDTVATVLRDNGFEFDMVPYVSLIRLTNHVRDTLFCGEIWVYRKNHGPEDLNEHEDHDFVVEISRHGGEDGFLAYNLMIKLQRALCPNLDPTGDEEDLLWDTTTAALGDVAIGDDNFDGVPLDSRTYDDLRF